MKPSPEAGREVAMKRVIILLGILALLAPTGLAAAADDSKVRAATGQVERGAKKIGEGKIGTGVEETAKGIGHTAVEGAKYSGEKLKESGKAAEPEAKSTWQNLKETANAFGGTVKTFVTRLFSN
jgi:hypothetical protein